MANIVWTGNAGDHIWSNQNNWNPVQTPTLSDNVTVGGVAYVNYVGGLAHNLTLNANVDIGGSNVNSTAALIVSGSIVNSAQLYLNRGATAYTASLEFQMSTQLAQSQLSGGGTILLSDSANNVIDASANGVALVNQDNTISGAGQFGGASAVKFDNQAQGVIDATGTNNQLIINTTAASTNEGLIEATGAAGLKVFGSTINSSGGGVVSAAGGSVFLSNGTLIGGTLQTSGGGAIQTIGTANTLSGVTNSGSIRVNDNTSLILENTIANSVGTITMLAGNNDTNLIIGTTGATLVGPGLITLTDSSHNLITGQGNAVPTLDNLANIISGAGTIGGNAGNSLTVENAGVITATGVENPLIIDTGGTFTNSGVLSATGPAGLQIENTTVAGTAGGQIIANAPGAHVDLQNAHLIGGTLRTVGTGAEIVADGQNSILDGTLTNLDNAGTLEIGTEDSIQIWGTIKNSGTIDLAAVVGTADLTAGLVTGATLTGGGAVTMSAASGNTITGQSGSNFTNSDNTISGSGSIVDMTLTNGGTIDATDSSVALLVNTGNTVTNSGVLEANSGTLNVSDVVTGSGFALITAGGTISFTGSFQENTAFQGAGALVLSQTYGGAISGFGLGDSIDLADLPYKTSYFAVWRSNGTLAVEDSANGNAIVATLAFSGNYDGSSFALSDDNNTTLIAGTGEIAPPSFPENQGDNDEWILSGGQWEASAGPGSHPSGYDVAGIGDWTASGTDGILWFDPTTGDTDEWQLANTQWAASVDLGSHPGNYQITGVGDFNGDGVSDVLWTSTSGGGVQTDIWELGTDGKWTNSVSPGSHPAGYSVAGIGDWTGNGTDGILWYNAGTGDTDEWQLSGGRWANSVDLGAHPGNYQIAGIGDFFGNNIDDVLWTGVNGDGTVATDIWELSSTGQWMASVSPGDHPAGYQVVGVGDFAGTGTSGILWYDASTGDTDEWLINNGKWAGSIDLGVHPGNFQISGVGDFTGTGTSDVLWHSPS